MSCLADGEEPKGLGPGNLNAATRETMAEIGRFLQGEWQIKLECTDVKLARYFGKPISWDLPKNPWPSPF